MFGVFGLYLIVVIVKKQTGKIGKERVYDMQKRSPAAAVISLVLYKYG